MDLTKYKRPSTAARKLYEWCCKQSRSIGQNPDAEVNLWSPEESDRLGYGRAWRVCWESGPFEWAVSLTLGGSAFGPELNDYSYTKPPEVILTGSRHWIAEPYHRFDVGFYPS